MADSKYHPALTVNNIKNFVPITLEMEKGHYNSWATLFKIHCRAYLVEEHLNHDQPPPPATTSSDKDKAVPPSPPDMAMWSRLDAIVL